MLLVGCVGIVWLAALVLSGVVVVAVRVLPAHVAVLASSSVLLVVGIV